MFSRVLRSKLISTASRTLITQQSHSFPSQVQNQARMVHITPNSMAPKISEYEQEELEAEEYLEVEEEDLDYDDDFDDFDEEGKLIKSEPDASVEDEEESIKKFFVDKYFIPNDIFDTTDKVYATGKKKSSIARVWIKPGNGSIIINNKPLVDYFQYDHRDTVITPFCVTKTACLYDVEAKVHGGGIGGQAEAVRLGISKCLRLISEDLRQPLRRVGFLTRDARVVEKKKFGQPKARKHVQWVKR